MSTVDLTYIYVGLHLLCILRQICQRENLSNGELQCATQPLKWVLYFESYIFLPTPKKCPCKDKEALVTFLIGVCTEGIQPTALLLHLNTFSCDERVFLKEFWDSVLGFVISVA